MMTGMRSDGTQPATLLRGDVAPTVFLVEAAASTCPSLRRVVEAAGWRAETFPGAQELLARPRTRGPSCLIIDMAMPGLDGLDLQRRIAADRPETPILFTGCTDVRVVVQAMKAGAVEILAALWRDEVLVDAVESALERSRRLLARQARLMDVHESYRALTPREREVMVLVVSGLLNKQVAGELGISEITVKAHRGQVMRKMRATSLPALVRMVGDLGLPTSACA
ncbi:response regulator transcription factor [Luteitalea sp.]